MFFHAALIAGATELISAEFLSFMYVCNLVVESSAGSNLRRFNCRVRRANFCRVMYRIPQEY